MALRFDERLKAGRGRERLYVLPTTNGYVVLGCRGPLASAPTWQRACDRAARGLRVRGATAVAPSPDPATAATLSKTMSTLGKARTRRVTALAATAARVRAQAATALVAAHRAAAAQVRAISRGPQDRGTLRDLEEALTRLSGQFAAMSRAAASDDSARYELARRRIHTADRRFRRALERLRASGYRVG